MDERLMPAAQSGSICALYALIRESPYVLENIDAVPFIDTPLHIAAASGRIEFAMEMMNLKPSFARKLNPDGFSPLHLAFANKQTRLVLELLKIDPSLIRVKGREGMTPLHLVVKEGDADLLAEFLLACPECIRDVNVNGETALHIAVMNGRYGELEVLTGWIRRMSQKDAASVELQVLNRRDREGNTALHLAAYGNQHQALRLLLGCHAVNRNIQNENGLTALDILQSQRQNMDVDIKKIMEKSGAEQSISLPKVKTVSDFLRSKFTFSEYYSTTMARQRTYISDGTRDALLVISTLIITATYQTALSPPGGVQEDSGGAGKSNNEGKVVMNEIYFDLLWAFNSTGFWSAILVTFILLPVGRECTVWFLSIALPLCVSYAVSMAVISPNSLVYIFSTFVIFFVSTLSYVIVFAWTWRKSKLKKIPEPRSELILEGFTTLRQARGVE